MSEPEQASYIGVQTDRCDAVVGGNYVVVTILKLANTVIKMIDTYLVSGFRVQSHASMQTIQQWWLSMGLVMLSVCAYAVS